MGLTWAIVYWFWSASLPDERRGDVRRHIALSILWGPVVGFAGFMALVMALQVVLLPFAMF